MIRRVLLKWRRRSWQHGCERSTVSDSGGLRMLGSYIGEERLRSELVRRPSYRGWSQKLRLGYANVDGVRSQITGTRGKMATSDPHPVSTFHGVLHVECALFVGVGISMTATTVNVCDARSVCDIGGDICVVCPWSTPSYCS